MPSTYCLYTAQQSNSRLRPQIQTSDKFCVDCPEGGSCRGTVGQVVGVNIRDSNGTEESVRAMLENAACTDCPDGAHRGFTFVPESSGGGGW